MSRLSRRVARICWRLTRRSRQNKKAEVTIANAAHVLPKRLKDHTSRSAGTTVESITSTAISVTLAQNTFVITPSRRIVGESLVVCVVGSPRSSLIAASFSFGFILYATAVAYAREVKQRITQMQYLLQFSLRTSENAQKAKFAEFLFHALG